MLRIVELLAELEPGSDFGPEMHDARLGEIDRSCLDAGRARESSSAGRRGRPIAEGLRLTYASTAPVSALDADAELGRVGRAASVVLCGSADGDADAEMAIARRQHCCGGGRRRAHPRDDHLPRRRHAAASPGEVLADAPSCERRRGRA